MDDLRIMRQLRQFAIINEPIAAERPVIEAEDMKAEVTTPVARVSA